MGIIISIEFDGESPGKFDPRTLNRETLNRETGRTVPRNKFTLMAHVERFSDAGQINETETPTWMWIPFGDHPLILERHRED